MGVVLDTSVLIAAERGTFALRELLEKLGDAEAGISAVTASELLVGGHRAADPGVQSRRFARVEYILRDLPVFEFGLVEARRHAELWARLMRAGSLIGPHDMLIAATALSRGFQLVTLNSAEFRRVSGLELVEVEEFVVR